jgi:hypothetical protein
MTNGTPAKIYSDQRALPIYLGDSGDGFTLPFKEKWRAPDAAAAVIGFIVTGATVTANINGGNALRVLLIGAAVTFVAVWLLSKLPAGPPSLPTRARWLWENTFPRVSCSHRRPR